MMARLLLHLNLQQHLSPEESAPSRECLQNNGVAQPGGKVVTSKQAYPKV